MPPVYNITNTNLLPWVEPTVARTGQATIRGAQAGVDLQTQIDQLKFNRQMAPLKIAGAVKQLEAMDMEMQAAAQKMEFEKALYPIKLAAAEQQAQMLDQQIASVKLNNSQKRLVIESGSIEKTEELKTKAAQEDLDRMTFLAEYEDDIAPTFNAALVDGNFAALREKMAKWSAHENSRFMHDSKLSPTAQQDAAREYDKNQKSERLAQYEFDFAVDSYEQKLAERDNAVQLLENQMRADILADKVVQEQQALKRTGNVPIELMAPSKRKILQGRLKTDRTLSLAIGNLVDDIMAEAAEGGAATMIANEEQLATLQNLKTIAKESTFRRGLRTLGRVYSVGLSRHLVDQDAMNTYDSLVQMSAGLNDPSKSVREGTQRAMRSYLDELFFENRPVAETTRDYSQQESAIRKLESDLIWERRKIQRLAPPELGNFLTNFVPYGTRNFQSEGEARAEGFETGDVVAIRGIPGRLT